MGKQPRNERLTRRNLLWVESWDLPAGFSGCRIGTRNTRYSVHFCYKPTPNPVNTEGEQRFLPWGLEDKVKIFFQLWASINLGCKYLTSWSFWFYLGQRQGSGVIFSTELSVWLSCFSRSPWAGSPCTLAKGEIFCWDVEARSQRLFYLLPWRNVSPWMKSFLVNTLFWS